MTLLIDTVKKIESLIADECAVLADWWSFWWVRRAHICEIFRVENAPTTNNMAESQHSSWDKGGAVKLSLPELAVYDMGEALLLEAYHQGIIFL